MSFTLYKFPDPITKKQRLIVVDKGLRSVPFYPHEIDPERELHYLDNLDIVETLEMADRVPTYEELNGRPDQNEHEARAYKLNICREYPSVEQLVREELLGFYSFDAAARLADAVTYSTQWKSNLHERLYDLCCEKDTITFLAPDSAPHSFYFSVKRREPLRKSDTPIMRNMWHGAITYLSSDGGSMVGGLIMHRDSVTGAPSWSTHT